MSHGSVYESSIPSLPGIFPSSTPTQMDFCGLMKLYLGGMFAAVF